MKYVSWNVNGLRAVMRKGFDQIYRSLDADVLCLQETKLSDYPEGTPLGDNIFHYWNNAERKGYSGTAILTRRQPQSVTMGIGTPEHDREGRVITADFGSHYLVNVYTPNSQEGLARLDYRMQWEQAFADYVCALDAVKPVIICGDLNVAHCEIDIRNPKTNRHSAGFTDEERSAMDRLLKCGFTDTFRQLHPMKCDIRGGATDFRHAPRTSDGASTISLSANASCRNYAVPTSSTTSSAATTAPSPSTSTSNHH